MFRQICKTIRSEKGEMYVGESVKIVIGIVIGSLILAGLIAVFNIVLLPKTEQWFAKMFRLTDSYMGIMESEAYSGGDVHNAIMEIASMCDDDSFYNKWKEDPEMGSLVSIYSGLAAGGTYYGTTGEDIKKDFEACLADPGAADWGDKEIAFATDWLNAYQEYHSPQFKKRYQNFSGEVTHYMMQFENEEITEDKFRELVIASGQRHAINGEQVLEYMFG